MCRLVACDILCELGNWRVCASLRIQLVNLGVYHTDHKHIQTSKNNSIHSILLLTKHLQQEGLQQVTIGAITLKHATQFDPKHPAIQSIFLSKFGQKQDAAY